MRAYDTPLEKNFEGHEINPTPRLGQSVVVVGLGQGAGVVGPGIGWHKPMLLQMQGHAVPSKSDSTSGATIQTGTTGLTEGFTAGTCMMTSFGRAKFTALLRRGGRKIWAGGR